MEITRSYEDVDSRMIESLIIKRDALLHLKDIERILLDEEKYPNRDL